MFLNGTWPLRTHADRFFGTVEADGQFPKVAGLVCYQGEILALSLVGYDTSVSAVLATLWSSSEVSFLPNAKIEWRGPLSLRRKATDHYKQFSGKLVGTREMHYMALSERANIGEGILHPLDLPVQPTTPSGSKSAASSTDQEDRARFVLGNWDEEYPHLRSFLGTLYRLRVLFLHKDAAHPEWQGVWAQALWERGSVRRLIVPIKEALGFKAWVVSSDLNAWGRLVGDGTREGWLPWRASTAPQNAASSRKDASLQLAVAR